MTTATVTRAPAPPHQQRASFGGLLHSEWTKIRSVRSTAWSLAALVVLTIGLNTLIVGLTMASWSSVSAADKASYTADPTGFLAAALGVAQIPLCVFAVLVITNEFSTGMISSSVLSVPRRTPVLVAKVLVCAAISFVIGEVIAFASFLIAQAIIGNRLPESLGSAATFRGVAGVGLYLTVLGIFALAVGAAIRHTGAAITAMVALVTLLAGLATLLPGSAGKHIAAYLPSNAGMLITHAHQEAGDLLSPWQGLGVLCIWAAAAFTIAIILFTRRDV